MNNNIFTYLVIFALVFLVSVTVRYVANKINKPKYQKNVQMPGKLPRFIVNLLMFLDGLLILLAIIGIVTKEIEMALASGGLALFFLAMILLLKREYKMSYQENDEYFMLKIRNKEYKVLYDNIIDWRPSFNEISILDQTKDEKYIRVNIIIFKPEILLRKIADMAFDEKFKSLDDMSPEDPYRKVETINYLVSYQYGYLVEDYIKKVSNLE